MLPCKGRNEARLILLHDRAGVSCMGVRRTRAHLSLVPKSEAGVPTVSVISIHTHLVEEVACCLSQGILQLLYLPQFYNMHFYPNLPT